MDVMPVKDRDELAEVLGKAREALGDAAQEITDDLARILEQVDAALARLRDEASTTSRDLAERFNLSEEALVAFAQTVAELLDGESLTVRAARRGAMLAAADRAWEGELGPLLPSAQVRNLLGDVSRQRVDELLRAKRLIGLRERSGRRSYPLFQFDDGRPSEPLIHAFYTIVDAGLDEWSAASWCVRPDPALGGDSPAQWVRARSDLERLAEVARQDARRFAQ
jgi:hypothetical protein